MNGYQKSASTFRDNGRVRALDVQVNGSPQGRLLLDDRMGEQRLPLAADPGDRVRLTIASVFPGARYEDVAVSEAYIACGP